MSTNTQQTKTLYYVVRWLFDFGPGSIPVENAKYFTDAYSASECSKKVQEYANYLGLGNDLYSINIDREHEDD